MKPSQCEHNWVILSKTDWACTKCKSQSNGKQITFKPMKPYDIFMTFESATGEKIQIREPKGGDLFLALINAKGDTNAIVKYLCLEMTYINEVKINEYQLNEMNIKDAMFLMQCVSSSMDTKKTDI